MENFVPHKPMIVVNRKEIRYIHCEVTISVPEEHHVTLQYKLQAKQLSLRALYSQDTKKCGRRSYFHVVIVIKICVSGFVATMRAVSCEQTFQHIAFNDILVSLMHDKKYIPASLS